MNSLYQQGTPGMQNIIGEMVEMLQNIDVHLMSVPDFILLFLKKRYRKTCILKRQRWYLRGTPDVNDSYILGIVSWESVLGIKIHPDIYRCCKRIYEDPSLLHELSRDQDLPNILETHHIHGFRVVFYVWDKSPILPYCLEKYPKKIGAIQQALRWRMASLHWKWLALIGAEPRDFTYSDGAESITLLDANKIWARETRTIPKNVDSRVIAPDWVEKLLQQK